MKNRFLGFVIPWIAFVAGAMAAPPDSASVTADGRQVAAAYDAAIVAASAGDLASAQTVLFATNTQRPNTPEFDLESAGKLAHLAFFLRGRLDYEHATLAAEQALALLAPGGRVRGANVPASRRAQAYELLGLLYEQLLVDVTQAKAAYEQAQQLNPNSKAADAGLTRLRANDERQARATGKKG
jgi:tetratricopeptide (TPR) repeat protein